MACTCDIDGNGGEPEDSFGEYWRGSINSSWEPRLRTLTLLFVGLFLCAFASEVMASDCFSATASATKRLLDEKKEDRFGICGNDDL